MLYGAAMPAPEPLVAPFEAVYRHALADPFPIYALYRERDPVHAAPPPDPRLVEHRVLFRHADVRLALRDARFGRDSRAVVAPSASPLPEALREIVELFQGFMLFVDPPQHTALRGEVSAAFRPAKAARLRSFIVARAHALLDQVRGEELELIRDFARPLTEAAIAELMGVPEALRAALKSGVRGIAPLFGGDARALATASGPALELRALFARLLAGDAEPGGLLAEVGAQLGGDEAGIRRATATASFIYGAGFATTVHGIANAVLALLRAPPLWDELAARASDLAQPVEELLRFDPPIHRSQRFALEDLEIGGVCVRRGALITPVLASANRDPAVFADPDRLDFARDAREQLAFGGGIHTCLGAWMARFELELGLRALLERLHAPALTDAPLEWREAAARGLVRLPLRVLSLG